MKNRGCATPTLELVQTGPSLVLKFQKFKNEAWPSMDQLNGGFGAPPTFHLVPLSFEFDKSVYFLLGETVSD